MTNTDRLVLLVDNYDSFVYTLASYVEEMGWRTAVVRNDAMSAEAIHRTSPDRIILSPGPGTPDRAGVSLDLLASRDVRCPILGVCLGHQAIGQAYGGRVVRARRPMHGRTSSIAHDGLGVFRGLPSPLRATRYHSLIVSEAGLPSDLLVSARSEEGEIMGLRHAHDSVEGVQFHPEALLTEGGHRMIENFLRGDCPPGREPLQTVSRAP